MTDVKNLKFNDLLPIYQAYTRLDEASNELGELIDIEKNKKKQDKLDEIRTKVNQAYCIMKYLDLNLLVAQTERADEYY